jgi:hypothetical protein
VFYTDVTKVNQDVAYVATVCARMLKNIYPNVSSVFQTYVATVFIWMLRMFNTYVPSVLSGCCVCVAMVFTCFFKYFIRMF